MKNYLNPVSVYRNPSFREYRVSILFFEPRPHVAQLENIMWMVQSRNKNRLREKLRRGLHRSSCRKSLDYGKEFKHVKNHSST